MTTTTNTYTPPAPDLSERRRRALLLRLVASRESGEPDLNCGPTLRQDFKMKDEEIEEAVARVRGAL